MNISRENIDDLNAVIRIVLEPADYQPRVDATLADYRKKVRFDGFRPGKVPPTLVKKMYGKGIQADEIQRLLSETINNHIRDNKLKILAEPLPDVNSPQIDWDTAEVFEFLFDIALAPEFDLKLSNQETINSFTISITPEMIDEQVNQYSRRFGTLQPVDTISDEDVVMGDLCQVADPAATPEEAASQPIQVPDTRMYIKSIDDKKIKKQFIGAKVGDKLTFSPEVAFPNETDRSNLLRVTKEELNAIHSDFEFTVKEISRFIPAEINQELFDKAYGEGKVDSIESFRTQVEEELSRQMAHESKYKFHIDAQAKLMADTDIQLPEEFLKRWMLLTTKDASLTREQLDKDFPAFAHDLKWKMIKDKIIADQDLKAEDDEIREQAIWAAQSRYFQYGIYDALPEQLFKLADVLLKNEEEKNRIADTILENKVIDYVSTVFGLVEQSISLEDFNKMMDENKR